MLNVTVVPSAFISVPVPSRLSFVLKNALTSEAVLPVLSETLYLFSAVVVVSVNGLPSATSAVYSVSLSPVLV